MRPCEFGCCNRLANFYEGAGAVDVDGNRRSDEEGLNQRVEAAISRKAVFLRQRPIQWIFIG